MPSTLKHVQRYAEIINIFIKYGFKDIITQLKIETQDTNLPQEKTDSRDKWLRLRLALEELGPTFIKLGQIISNRPDEFPPDLVAEMENLQDAVPPFSEEDARNIIETELQTKIESVFKIFEPQPFASGSIAQVHNAILFTDQQVVVKVQRPNIVEKVQADIEILLTIAGLMESYMDGMKTIQPVDLIKNFEKSIKEELNFNNEVLNIKRFEKNFEGDPAIYVPKTFKAYCTQRVLVMEYIQGTKVSEVDKLENLNISREQVADSISDLFFKQFFQHGFFHADPHPGNIVVQSDKICFIDFGMMGKINAKDRELLSSIFIGIERNDTSRIIRGLKRLAMNEDVRGGRKLEFQVQELIDQYIFLEIGEVKLGNILMKFKAILIENNIQVPPDLFLLLRSLTIMEGVVTNLVPHYNIIKKMEPFVERLMQDKFKPENLANDIRFSAYDSYNFLQKLPYELEEVFYKLRKGKTHIEFEHKGLEGLIDKLDIVSNRIVLSIILASIVIASSLMVLSHIPPTYNGIPVIGLIGYIIASILGLTLIINILRHGKLK